MHDLLRPPPPSQTTTAAAEVPLDADGHLYVFAYGSLIRLRLRLADLAAGLRA
jgi:hypothetical protein